MIHPFWLKNTYLHCNCPCAIQFMQMTQKNQQDQLSVMALTNHKCVHSILLQKMIAALVMVVVHFKCLLIIHRFQQLLALFHLVCSLVVHHFQVFTQELLIMLIGLNQLYGHLIQMFKVMQKGALK